MTSQTHSRPITSSDVTSTCTSLAFVFRRMEVTAYTSMSAASTLAAPAFMHAIAIIPDPDPKSSTRLPARPGKRPIGGWHTHLFEFFFRLAPQRHHFGRQVKPYLRHQRRRDQFRIVANELGGIVQSGCGSGLEDAIESTSR